MRIISVAAALLVASLAAQPAAARPSYTLTLHNQQFDPAELNVPAGQKIELHVVNSDAIPAEFESADLQREKVVPPHDRVIVYVGPLHAGTYTFFNDFHPQSRGRIIAK